MSQGNGTKEEVHCCKGTCYLVASQDVIVMLVMSLLWDGMVMYLLVSPDVMGIVLCFTSVSQDMLLMVRWVISVCRM